MDLPVHEFPGALAHDGFEGVAEVEGGGIAQGIADYFALSPVLEMQLKGKDKESERQVVNTIAHLARVESVCQKEPKGLGDAVLCARDFVGEEPFAVMLGDDIIHNPGRPAMGQLLDAYTRFGCPVIGMRKVPHGDVNRYGIISGEPLSDGVCMVEDLVEKPSVEEAPTDMAIMGRYVLTPDIFDSLRQTGPGAGGEIQLTDGLRKLARRKKIIGLAFEGQRYHVGDPLAFLKANVEYGLRSPEFGGEFQKYLRCLDLNGWRQE